MRDKSPIDELIDAIEQAAQATSLVADAAMTASSFDGSIGHPMRVLRISETANQLNLPEMRTRLHALLDACVIDRAVQIGEAQ